MKPQTIKLEENARHATKSALVEVPGSASREQGYREAAAIADAVAERYNKDVINVRRRWKRKGYCNPIEVTLARVKCNAAKKVAKIIRLVTPNDQALPRGGAGAK